jgi:hypothetical protein
MPAIAIMASQAWSASFASNSIAVPLKTQRILHAALFFVIVVLTPWAANRFGGQRPGVWEIAAFGALSGAWLWVALTSGSNAPVAWARLVILTAASCALAFALLGPPLAQSHSSRDLAGYFNARGSLPSTIYVMDQRVSFVYYLRPDVRRGLRADQIQSVSVEALDAMRPFPHDAVVALPADLAGRLLRVAELRNAPRHVSGRYVIVEGDRR